MNQPEIVSHITVTLPIRFSIDASPEEAEKFLSFVKDNYYPKDGMDFIGLPWELNLEADYENVELEEKKRWVNPPKEYKKDVHTEHCCLTCGCKYGDSDCTVTTCLKPQSIPCDGHCGDW